MAAEETDAAAIGSAVAAEIYGLKIICENIEDTTNNITRFLVICPKTPSRPARTRPPIFFSTAHKAGALADVLDVFKKYEINLTNIESRPSKKRQWEYYFFVDFLGHSGEKVQDAMDEARKALSAAFDFGQLPAGDGFTLIVENFYSEIF